MHPLLVVTLGSIVLLATPLLWRLAMAATRGRDIGAQALADQPDAIHLVRVDAAGWSDAAAVERRVLALCGEGFEDAGDFHVAEMPMVRVRLLVHPGEAWVAALYEHPVAGCWCEIGVRFDDDSTALWTSLPPTGLAAQPGSMRVHLQHAEPERLLARARVERPSWPAHRVSVADVAAAFEDAYARAIAWRKAQGISAAEVVAVTLRRAA